MLKQKLMRKSQKLIVWLLIFSMLAIYGSVPLARAVSLTQAKDTLSTSAPSASATHSIQFHFLTSIPTNGYYEVTVDANFGNVGAGGTCSDGMGYTTPGNAKVARCTNAGGSIGSKTLTLTIPATTNAAATASYVETIKTYDNNSVLMENVQIRVAILPQVTMTATVNATLAFTVNGTTTGVSVNGLTTNNVSTATATPFGTLTVGATSTVGQDLSVTTNAANGYIVTVQQNQELTDSSGDNINSFDNSSNNTGSTTPHAWTSPSGVLDQKMTYGHMGLTTNDADLGTGAPNDGFSNFNGGLFAGLNGTSTMVIMAHSGAAAGPADGQTQNKGKASVLYMVQISALQEAGDYTNTLTYICTPTF